MDCAGGWDTVNHELFGQWVGGNEDAPLEVCSTIRSDFLESTPKQRNAESGKGIVSVPVHAG